jgi:hypothetical protein
MEKKENGLEYLQMLIRFYVDGRDKGMEAFLLNILQGIERMKVCI